MAPIFTANWFNFGRNPASGAAAAPQIQATGGTTVTPGNGYKYHVFQLPQSPATFALTDVGGEGNTFEVLVVGSGGGGGGGANASWYVGGGGGAGGVAYATSITLTSGNYTVQVGEGGSPGNAHNNYAPDGNDGLN